MGNYPRKWDKTGTVVEVRQFDQYFVKVDGSGRVTLRNRKFLRHFTPVSPRMSPTTITSDMRFLPYGGSIPPTPPSSTPLLNAAPLAPVERKSRLLDSSDSSNTPVNGTTPTTPLSADPTVNMPDHPSTPNIIKTLPALWPTVVPETSPVAPVATRALESKEKIATATIPVVSVPREKPSAKNSQPTVQDAIHRSTRVKKPPAWVSHGDFKL